MIDFYKTIINYNVKVIEDKGEIIFQHKIIEGGTNRSYGVHVAKLAGIPHEVIERSNLILEKFEDSNSNKKNKGIKNKRKYVPKPKKISPEQLGLI